VEIRQIDVYDDRTFEAYFAIMREAELFERPHAPMWSLQEAAVMFRHPEETEDWEAFAAFEGDTMVGVGFVITFTMDNQDKAFTKVFVRDDMRRRGIGGALLEHASSRAADLGRTTLIAEAAYPFDQRGDHHHRRFLEGHGFELATVEIRRCLDLPIPEAQLQRWIDEAAVKHEGYEIRSYVGPLPDEILPSLCHVLSLLPLEAPTGDLELEPETLTPEIWREREKKIAEQDRTVFTTVAIEPGGDVVAATQLVVPEHDFPKVYQWATLVLREHRGHRLGLGIKAHNLRALQHAHPDRTEVWTANEETNGPMVDINEMMGFYPVDMEGGFQRKTSASAAG
jgi:GNAT superfamily N-acetyltransferase